MMLLHTVLLYFFFQPNYSERRKPLTEKASANASMFDYVNFQNQTINDAIKALANKGWAALNDAEFKEVGEISYSFPLST